MSQSDKSEDPLEVSLKKNSFCLHPMKHTPETKCIFRHQPRCLRSCRFSNSCQKQRVGWGLKTACRLKAAAGPKGDKSGLSRLRGSDVQGDVFLHVVIESALLTLSIGLTKQNERFTPNRCM